MNLCEDSLFYFLLFAIQIKGTSSQQKIAHYIRGYLNTSNTKGNQITYPHTIWFSVHSQTQSIYIHKARAHQPIVCLVIDRWCIIIDPVRSKRHLRETAITNNCLPTTTTLMNNKGLVCGGAPIVQTQRGECVCVYWCMSAIDQFGWRRWWFFFCWFTFN